jgi:glycosyltransferase involved in cell wall biosynthesis
MEIIVVDDGSTDKTLEIVRSFAEQNDVSIKVYSQKWKGIASARNLVVKKAGGEYLIWVDADMTLSKNFVQKQVEFLERHPRVGAAKGKYGFIRSNKIVAKLENCRAFNIMTPSRDVWGTGGAIYRVSALREIGGFDEKIRGAGEDIDALIRLKKMDWLASLTDAIFYERYKESWKEFWKQYFWWGYGAHFVKHKHKNFISVFARLPPVALVAGVLRFLKAFKHEHDLIYLILPFYELFKETSWLMGFVIGHFNGYGHIVKR